jgi:cell division protein FtsN
VAGLAPSETIAPAPIAKPSNFYVQAGAFRDEKNALNFSNALSSHGNSKVYLSQTNNTPTFRVKLGPYASNEEATTALSALRASGKSGIVIAE